MKFFLALALGLFARVDHVAASGDGDLEFEYKEIIALPTCTGADCETSFELVLAKKCGGYADAEITIAVQTFASDDEAHLDTVNTNGLAECTTKRRRLARYGRKQGETIVLGDVGDGAGCSLVLVDNSAEETKLTIDTSGVTSGTHLAIAFQHFPVEFEGDGGHYFKLLSGVGNLEPVHFAPESAGHDHDHRFLVAPGDHVGCFEYHAIYPIEETGDLKLLLQKKNGKYGADDTDMMIGVVAYGDDAEANLAAAAGAAGGLDKSTCTDVAEGSAVTVDGDVATCHKLTFDQAKATSTYTITRPATPKFLVILFQHNPGEFESGTHFLKETDGTTDVEAVHSFPEDAHAGHDHGSAATHVTPASNLIAGLFVLLATATMVKLA